MSNKSFIEVQFPIGPLSLESYIERLPYVGKPLNSLGKWWGTKPLVLTRAIILGAVMPASDDPERWADDLDIFLKCMCLDNAGMWKRKVKSLPASSCYAHATSREQEELFESEERWLRRADRELKEKLEKRVFYTLGHTEQREYCCRIEEIDGPPEESWLEINRYLGISAASLSELIQQLAKRRYGTRLKVGDAFCGMGSIPFEAAELGCDVYASDLNPVACLLTWGALSIIGGTDEFRTRVHNEQQRIYGEVDTWIQEHVLETSEEGWRAEAYLYCVEIEVPELDGWRIPISPSWVIAPKLKTWVELVPIESERRFTFRVHNGGSDFAEADQGTKQGQDIVCPQPLRKIFKRHDRLQQIPLTISYNRLIENAEGLRRWEKSDFMPRPGDVLQERLYCIRWRLPYLPDLLAKEQAIRQKGGTDLRALERVDSLIAGLLPFLSEKEQTALTKLRKRDWWREDNEIAELEQELKVAHDRKRAAGDMKVLREKLKKLRADRQKRQSILTAIAARIPGIVYREPRSHDLDIEQKVVDMLSEVFDDWQQAGWIPNWRIEPGEKTDEPIRTRGWNYWHHLFTPRQLLMLGQYSKQLAVLPREEHAALTLTFGILCNYTSRLCHWRPRDGGGVGGTNKTFYNQAFNAFYNYPVRSWAGLANNALNKHREFPFLVNRTVSLKLAQDVDEVCTIWITDPPYAGAVNYEELSEFFLAWYVPHLKAVFPDWYTDSMRARAVKGNDAPFRVAMAECYRRLAEHMPDDGMQVLMFTPQMYGKTSLLSCGRQDCRYGKTSLLSCGRQDCR